MIKSKKMLDTTKGSDQQITDETKNNILSGRVKNMTHGKLNEIGAYHQKLLPINGNNPEIIWHYTTLQHLYEIIKDGVLKVSYVERQLGDKKPSIWFSKEQYWEPSVYLTNEQSVTGQARMKLLRNLPGIGRIGIKFSKERFNTWAKYKHVCKLPEDIIQSMEDLQKNDGCNLLNCYCLFNDVKKSEWVSVQKFDGMDWIDIVSVDVEEVQKFLDKINLFKQKNKLITIQDGNQQPKKKKHPLKMAIVNNIKEGDILYEHHSFDIKMKDVSEISEENAKAIIRNNVGEDYFYEPVSGEIFLDYPLSVFVKIRVFKVEFVGSLLWKVAQAYKQIYEEDDETSRMNLLPQVHPCISNGKYGIRGHDFSDLYFEGIKIYSNKVIEIVIGS